MMSDETKRHIVDCAGVSDCENTTHLKMMISMLEMESTVHLMSYQDQVSHCTSSHEPVLVRQQARINELEASVVRLTNENGRMRVRLGTSDELKSIAEEKSDELKSIDKDNAGTYVHSDVLTAQDVPTRRMYMAEAGHVDAAMPWIRFARICAGPNDGNRISVYWHQDQGSFSLLTTEQFCDFIPWVKSEYMGTNNSSDDNVITSLPPVYLKKIPYAFDIAGAALKCAYRECGLHATHLCKSCLLVGYCGTEHAVVVTHDHVLTCARICDFMRAYRVNRANGRLCIRDSAVEMNLMSADDMVNLSYTVMDSAPHHEYGQYVSLSTDPIEEDDTDLTRLVDKLLG
jgi:hypothetical protein